MCLLTLNKVTASYGASQALFGIDLHINQGEVLALMGRNGMGKSTTIKVICRLLHHTGGEVYFDDHNLAHFPSYRATRLGIGLVPEGRRCFANLTVYENLIVAARAGQWDMAKIGSLFPRLIERKHQLASSLSGGEQQMLAIGRALMTNPRLLLLDEATEGLAPIVRQEIWAAIGQLKQQSNMAILVVDKSLKELALIADKAVILEKGRSVWAGDFNALNAQTRQRYLGV